MPICGLWGVLHSPLFIDYNRYSLCFYMRPFRAVVGEHLNITDEFAVVVLPAMFFLKEMP